MRLSVALNLCDLIDTFPYRTDLGILTVDRLPRERFNNGKHAPVTQIAVMCDGQYMPAGLSLIATHPLPQVPGIVAAVRLLCGVGFNQAGLACAIAKKDVAVKIVATGIRGPFETDKCRESSRIVGLLGRLYDFLPGTLKCGCSRYRENGFGNRAFAEIGNDIDRCGSPVSILNLLVPATTLRVGHDRWVTL